MNYEEQFGTNWTELDLDAALIRSFALGVASTRGKVPEDELDRLRSVAESRYELELIQTAYREGCQFDSRQTRVSRRDAVPEFIRKLGVEIDGLVGDGGASVEVDAAPKALSLTPVHLGIPTESPMLSLPELLVR